MGTTPDIPKRMRALVLAGTGLEHVALRDVPVPVPGPEQLLARVDAAGICTSLIKLAEQGPAHSYMYGWDTSRHPVILGDEGSVTLVRVGSALRDDYAPGQRFVVQPAVDSAPVNHLERYNHPERVHKVAVGHTLPGHLAEYMLIPEEVIGAGCLLPLPGDALPFAHAALSEPVSCCVSGQEHHLHLEQARPGAERSAYKGLKPGGLTLIIGAGAMGRMHVDVAMSYRPRAILVTDFIAERLERTRTLFGAKAARLGVELHLVEGGPEVLKRVRELSAHAGADDVIVAVGSAAAIETAQAYVARYGVLNLFGGLKKGEDRISLDTGMVHYREVNVTGSSGGTPWDIARTLELMAAGVLEASAHITQVGDLSHAPSLLEQIKQQELGGKAVVYPHRRTNEVLTVGRWRAEDERTYLESA